MPAGQPPRPRPPRRPRPRQAWSSGSPGAPGPRGRSAPGHGGARRCPVRTARRAGRGRRRYRRRQVPTFPPGNRTVVSRDVRRRAVGRPW